jgi:WD40 repeat protein
MKRSITGFITLLTILLLTGCGAQQPSGPPPALTFPTSTGTGSTSGGTAAGKTLHFLRLQQQVQMVAWSPDGTKLATATFSNPALFQVWDATTGQQVAAYNGSFSYACCLAWSPDGKEIASAGSETIQIWQAPAED